MPGHAIPAAPSAAFARSASAQGSGGTFFGSPLAAHRRERPAQAGLLPFGACSAEASALRLGLAYAAGIPLEG